MMLLDTFKKDKKHVKEVSRFDPARDWLLLLSGATLLFVGVFLWNVWLFQTVANGGTIGPAASQKPPIFKESALQVVRSLFISRAEEEAKYASGAYHFSDPSQ